MAFPVGFQVRFQVSVSVPSRVPVGFLVKYPVGFLIPGSRLNPTDIMFAAHQYPPRLAAV